MTLPPHEPPPEDYPAEDYPDGLPQQPPAGWMPAGYPPPGYPPNVPPPPGYPYPPAPPPSPRISVAMVFLGPLLYFIINFVLGFLAFMVGGSMSDGPPDAVFGLTALALAAIAFGGGAIMLVKGGPTLKGLGIGLMIGWALTSIFTVGICTGLNPELYKI